MDTISKSTLNEFQTCLKCLSTCYFSLVNGPDQFTNVQCPREKPYSWFPYQNCYLTNQIEESKSFMIVSRVDGKAIQGNPDGTAMFKTVDFNEPAQKWIQTSIGNQLLNLKTGKPIEIYDGKSWNFDDKMRIVNARKSQKVLASTWGHDDGRSVHMWPEDSWVSPTQRFCIVDAKHTKNELSGQKYLIKSKLDSRVIQGKINGDIEMQSETKSLNQQWIRIKNGNGEKLINVATRLPLVVSETQNWVYDEVKNTISDLKDSSKCLDRGWGQSDGINVALWAKWEGVTQQFSIDAIASQ